MMLLGAPGVGKGTYGKLLSASFGVPLLGTGDAIRAEIQEGSALGDRLRSDVAAGRLVPDEIVLGMVRLMTELEFLRLDGLRS